MWTRPVTAGLVSYDLETLGSGGGLLWKRGSAAITLVTSMVVTAWTCKHCAMTFWCEIITYTAYQPISYFISAW